MPGDLALLASRDSQVAAGAVLVLSAGPTPGRTSARSAAWHSPAGTCDGLPQERRQSRRPTPPPPSGGLGTWRFEALPLEKAAPNCCGPTAPTRPAPRRSSRRSSLARDLITTPSSDMGPAGWPAPPRLAKAHKALRSSWATLISTPDGSCRRPMPAYRARLDLAGQDSHPKGHAGQQGVCFDTGGLDLKMASGMLNMKKDAGGAATVLAVASMVMATRRGAPARAGAAVENSVSGNTFRPMDVVPTRKGHHRRDRQHRRRGRPDPVRRAARGRDREADHDGRLRHRLPRVARWADLPALFCNDDALADATWWRNGQAVHDPAVAPAAVRRLSPSCSTTRWPTSTMRRRRLRRRHHGGALSQGSCPTTCRGRIST